MAEQLLVAVTIVVVLGVSAQWIAWWLRVPSILLLLLVGFLAGIWGLLDPDRQFGDGLLAFLKVAVALILYEGGLTLRLRELHNSGGVVWRLVTLGAAVTWIVAGLAAGILLGLPMGLATLLGAILVVTGPTVIGPLLNHIRPTGRAGHVLKWEGIVIDPIGAMLAVLVFEILLAGSPQQATQNVALVALRTIAVGGVLGLGTGLLLVVLLREFLIPDFLENAISVMLVVAVTTLADHLQAESGLLAATVMGIMLANQKLVDVRHIVEFKENLRVLLISSLFVLLAARLRLQDFGEVGWSSLAFLAALVLVARPLSVLVSTIGSSLAWRERLFIAWIAPRGIVAAAVASVFALRLAAEGFPQAEALVPTTFLVIVGTVVLYGLTGAPVARWLKVAVPNPQGVLMVGAHGWARTIAATLQDQGFRVLLVDTNRANVAAARLAGLETAAGSILAEHALEDLDLWGLGKLIAATPNDWVNVLAVQRCARVFGRAEVYQLPARARSESEKTLHRHLHGRWLFGPEATFDTLRQAMAAGGTIKATRLTETFTFESFQDHYGSAAVPLFLVTENRQLLVMTADDPPEPRPGQVLVSLVREEEEEAAEGTEGQRD